MSLDPTILRTSFELVIDRRPDLTIRFYEILFVQSPDPRVAARFAQRRDQRVPDPRVHFGRDAVAPARSADPRRVSSSRARSR